MDSEKQHTSFTLPSQLDIENVRETHEALSAVHATVCDHLIIDAAKLETLTVPGMQVLGALAKNLEKEGKRLRLENMRSHVAESCRLCGFEMLLQQEGDAA